MASVEQDSHAITFHSLGKQSSALSDSGNRRDGAAELDYVAHAYITQSNNPDRHGPTPRCVEETLHIKINANIHRRSFDGPSSNKP